MASEIDADTAVLLTDTEQAEQMEIELHQNPYDYNKHLQYISMLKTLDDNFKIRVARESMRKVFPLTETLWLEWIHDALAGI